MTGQAVIYQWLSLQPTLKSDIGPSEFAQAIADAKAEARAASLTDADIGAELDPYNAERRGASAA